MLKIKLQLCEKLTDSIESKSEEFFKYIPKYIKRTKLKVN